MSMTFEGVWFRQVLLQITGAVVVVIIW